ncbi:MAG: NAD-binding protein [Gemmatimonadota bacterium]
MARLLFREGYDVIAIDRNETLVDRSVGEVTRAVAGDATDPALLREVGADGAQAAVVSTGGDLASSILAILALKEVRGGDCDPGSVGRQVPRRAGSARHRGDTGRGDLRRATRAMEPGTWTGSGAEGIRHRPGGRQDGSPREGGG